MSLFLPYEATLTALLDEIPKLVEQHPAWRAKGPEKDKTLREEIQQNVTHFKEEVLNYLDVFKGVVPNNFRMESEKEMTEREEIAAQKEAMIIEWILNITKNLLVLSVRQHLSSHISDDNLVADVKMLRMKHQDASKNSPEFQNHVNNVQGNLKKDERAKYFREVMEDIGEICVADGFEYEDQFKSSGNAFGIEIAITKWRVGFKSLVRAYAVFNYLSVWFQNLTELAHKLHPDNQSPAQNVATFLTETCLSKLTRLTRCQWCWKETGTAPPCEKEKNKAILECLQPMEGMSNKYQSFHQDLKSFMHDVIGDPEYMSYLEEFRALGAKEMMNFFSSTGWHQVCKTQLLSHSI